MRKNIALMIFILGLCSIGFSDTTGEFHCISDTVVNSIVLYKHQLIMNDTLMKYHYYGIEDNYVKRFAYQEPGDSVDWWEPPVPIVVKATNISIGDWWYDSFNNNTALVTVVDSLYIPYEDSLYLSYECVAVDSANGSYVSTSWYSENFGPIQSYVPFITDDTLKIDSSQIIGGYGFFPLCVGNSWILSTEDTAVDPTLKPIPYSFNLQQNYPNPFNPITTIEYNLHIPANVEMSIYNMKGQMVKRIVNEYKPVGHHSVKWNANGVSSGVYFYHIKVDEYSSAKKCIILK